MRFPRHEVANWGGRWQLIQVAFVAALAFGTISLACASQSQTNAHGSSSADSSMPVYNGRNGIISHGEEAAGFSNESLADWTKQPDFVAVAVVRSASKLYPRAGESWGDQSATTRMLTDSETYGALQHIEVTKVLWRNANGIKPPPSLDMVNLGWSRNSDAGEVFALLPENGPRLDVGDTFVAAFYNDRHRFDEKYQATEQYRNLPAHWGIFNEQGAIKVADGKLVTDERTVAYERPFAGLTVDEFKTKLIDASAP